MILKKKQLAVKVGQACTAIAIAAATQAAWAQETQRVEVTGSAIKRIAKEGALPVLTLTSEDIKKTGVTTATDLIQSLPAMQGFVPSSSSVNGSGAGVTTAALHSLQSKYTLVLLDGQRMAPSQLGSTQGGGFAVNLESIPLDAIERVEILTDGASALYGSDAIAGVVNFITKKNKTDGNVYFNYQSPQHPGAKSFSAGVTKGWGDLEVDKFNVLATLSHDEQDKLDASQRSFSKNGAYFPFNYNGKAYIFNQATGNTSPANLTFSAVPLGTPRGANGATATNADGSPVVAAKSYSINPYYTKNGNCGTPLASVLVGATSSSVGANTTCRFNYAATVQAIPETKRDSGLLKGTFKLNADTTLWSQLVLTSTEVTAEFAASAQPLGVNATTRLPSVWNTYIAPYLAANNLQSSGNLAGTGALATAGFRTVPLGGRANIYGTDATQFSFGVDGLAMGWNYKANVTLSRSKGKDTAAGGYLDTIKFNAAVAAGGFDPVAGTGFNTLSPALLNGTVFSTNQSDLNSLRLSAQHDMFEMAGGTSIVSLGTDYSTQRYRINYSDISRSDNGFSDQPLISDGPIGGSSGLVNFDAKRTNYGLYGEWLFPIVKGFEATASARYDSYSKTRSEYNYATVADPVTGLQKRLAPGDVGDTFDSTTYKVSFRWTPIDTLLLRGAYGTGFKAPNITDLAGPITFGGSTSGSYACPFPGSSSCLPGSAQYDLLAGANGLTGTAGLKPEKSKQWTIGFRLDPAKGLSLGADLWHVEIKNQVLSSGIAESVAFANPQTYKSLFVDPYIDPPGGFQTIGLLQLPINGGIAQYKGLDWDFSYQTNTAIGKLFTSWTGTRMLTMDYTQTPGGAVESSLGQFGPDLQVVFRTQMHLSVGLQTGPFTNTLTAHYKSGYKDQTYAAGTSIFLRNPDGSLGATTAFEGLDVPSYTTVDWQGKYDFSKVLTFTAGIKNLFDKDPVLSLQNAGGGNVIGYDPRYGDPIGRTYYITGNYKF